MRRLLAVLTLLIFGCSPRFQGMKALLEDPENIIIPFDSTFLEFESSMAHFNQLDQKLNDSIPRIVFTGSSSIRMWDSLAMDMDTFPHQVLNRGFGGSILSEVNYYFDDLIPHHQAEVVVLYCGENDIVDGYRAEEVMDSFRTFLRLLFDKSPATQVLYLSMKPSPSRWELWPEFEKANKLIAAFIKRLDNPNIRYLDIGTALLNEQQTYPRPELFKEDSLHMQRSGYVIWRDIVVSELVDLLECRDKVD
jgi:lysophospholipase L1-like esterase